MPHPPYIPQLSQITNSLDYEIGRSCCHWYWSSFRFGEKPRG